ncbi:MaoC/PaaZ C-terminal domain-containing protein [Sphingobium sp. Sx8-8]|uniref:MaoC/PaaZ C-terminal domain-containing protein n=1 Tax=Sphingobium sp. Sx8-8 TaxID=2933617 RepID=UPI001F5890D7|nr:MaoC/PaaZ C-terminal domain-containing protein [Sphingobium sp. Sx8-8]
MIELSAQGTYFEDIDVGPVQISSAVVFERDAIIAFAQQWDPLPVHLNDDAAKAAGFEGLTASGTHMLAVKQRLLHEFNLGPTVIASFGSDETRYHAPARPGDVVRLHFSWRSKRPSKSRPSCGIAQHLGELRRSDGVLLLSILDTILIRRREPEEAT